MNSANIMKSLEMLKNFKDMFDENKEIKTEMTKEDLINKFNIPEEKANELIEKMNALKSELKKKIMSGNVKNMNDVFNIIKESNILSSEGADDMLKKIMEKNKDV